MKKNLSISVWSSTGCLAEFLKSIREGKKIMRKAKDNGDSCIRMYVKDVNSKCPHASKYYFFEGDDIKFEVDYDLIH
jgi:hypothetical protein